MMRWMMMLTMVAAGLLVGCEVAPTDLLAGASWEYSIDAGETYSTESPTVSTDGEVVDLISRTTFPAPAGTDDIAELHLQIIVPYFPWYSTASMAINGVEIERLHPEVGYPTVRGINPAVLVEGVNELTVTDSFVKYGDEPEQLPATAARLIVMRADDLAFRTGPVLGAFTPEQFTVTCRTNMVADVVCRARPIGGRDDIVVESDRGLTHRFVIPRGEGDYAYRLEATVGDVTRMTEWLPAPTWAEVTDGAMRFAITSDVQSTSSVWPAHVARLMRQHPDLILATGDMVSNGRNDDEWDSQFLGPARELLAVTPLYPVEGNHEMESPLLDELFYTPAVRGEGLTWAQQVGDVLFIAINGLEDYNTGTPNYVWLEGVLAESDAKFIFLLSHYPGFGSNRFGGTDENGTPMDYKTWQAQHVIMPLLSRYNATAMVTAHDHFYERTEPEGLDVTAIISGGGGGGLEDRREDWRNQNPDSQVWTSEHHYMLFDVEGDECTMTAYGLTGEVIDTRTWQARAAE